jgi:hypothetical protein
MNTPKQMAEQNAFRRFIRNLQQEDTWISVESRPEPEPDLLCNHLSDGAIAVECVSITDPELAKVFAAGVRARRDVFTTIDPTGQIIRKKLHRSYKTLARRIDLLVYTDGRVISPDSQIMEVVLAWVASIEHPFTNVWYSGERVTKLLWSSA